MIVIVDTSVLVSYLLSKGKNNCRQIIQLARDKRVRLASSKEILNELKHTLGQSDIKKLPGYKSRLVASFIAWYQYNVEYFSIEDIVFPHTTRDTSDTMFLKLAIVSNAQYIISGDKDLLVIKQIKKTKIMNAAEFIISISKE